MTFILLFTVPYIRKHKFRTLLTLAGIVIGVALFTGMHGANRSVSRAFQHTVDRIAGKAKLQVSAGETGFPEEVLEMVRATHGVSAAAPVIEAVLQTGLSGEGNLLVLGVDMTGDRSLRDYDLEGQEDDAIEDPLVFLAQSDSLMLSRGFAQRNGIRRNRRLTLDTMNGPRQFTVRGIMRAEGLAGAFSGNLAIMDIYAAQMVFGRGRLFDRIDVGVAEGAAVAEVRSRLEAALGPAYQVEPPSSRSQHFDAISRALSISVSITSGFALLIGIFIIYNSFSIAVTQRRSEIGVLRALGATRGQVLAMFVTESAVAGVIGSALGILLGLGIARVLTPVLSYMVRQSYGAHQAPEEIVLGAGLVALAMCVGVLASVAGGFLPALNAARVDPVKALQKGRNQVFTQGENQARRHAALVLALFSALALFRGGGDILFYAGYSACVISSVLFSPVLAVWLARALRPVLERIRPVEGALAADSLIQSPRRTSATVSAVMLSLALAVSFSGVAQSILESVNDWISGALNAELVLSPTESITARQFRFPAGLDNQIAEVPGVAEVQPVRSARVMVNGAPAMILAADVERVARRIRFVPLEGQASEMIRLAREGSGVHISDTLARMRGFRVGGTLTIDTPGGKARFTVTGRVIDYSDQQGTIFMDSAVFHRYWQDQTSNFFRVYLAPGADTDAVRRAIQERFRGQRRMVVFTNKAMRQFVLDLTNQWFGLTYLQLAVALLVAILGIVNTLTISIIDRRRELGILRAVGAMRPQIRNTIWMEAVAIGFIGVILGAIMGGIMLYYNLGMIARDMAGLLLDYRYPFTFALALLPIVMTAAFAAAVAPAEAAVRASLVESLEYE